jgi:cellobiose-specific phosphotransferase system component IIA
MTTTTTITATRTSDVESAARCLHQAEQALHDAHTTHVDAWIAAAADRLHEAVETYLTAVAYSRC